MARYTTSIRSPLSPDAAYDGLADFTSVADWDPGVTGAVRVDDGELALGSAFDVDVAMGPKAITFRYHLTEIDPPHQFVLRAERGPFVSLDTVTVEVAEDGESIVTYDAVLELKGLLGLFDPVLAIGFRRVGDKAAEGLRRHLDGVTAS